MQYANCVCMFFNDVVHDCVVSYCRAEVNVVWFSLVAYHAYFFQLGGPCNSTPDPLIEFVCVLFGVHLVIGHGKGAEG